MNRKNVLFKIFFINQPNTTHQQEDIMRAIILIVIAVLLSSCCFTSAIRCRQLDSATVSEHFIVYPYSQGPIDITTTTIDFY